MYVVYKITNLINNKCYVGSSIRVDKRWREEKNSAFNPKDPSYKYPLQSAFRKYGVDNFSFEILKNDFTSIKEMTDYEKWAIIFYNGYPEGYNQTTNTDRADIASENLRKAREKVSQKCAKIDKNNNIIEVYSSYQEAGRKNGLENSASLIRDICKGTRSSLYGTLFFRDLDENGKIIEKPFKSYKSRKQLIAIPIDILDNNVLYFSSVSEAAKELNLSRCSIGKCLAGNSRYTYVGGYIFREVDDDKNVIEIEKTVKELQEEYDKRHPFIDGTRKTIPEWSKIYHISSNAINERIKKGWDSVKAITTPARK